PSRRAPAPGRASRPGARPFFGNGVTTRASGRSDHAGRVRTFGTLSAEAPMNEQQLDQHLSQIATMWTMLYQAHQGSAAEAARGPPGADAALLRGGLPLPAQRRARPQRRRRPDPGVRPALHPGPLPPGGPRARPLPQLRQDGPVPPRQRLALAPEQGTAPPRG